MVVASKRNRLFNLGVSTFIALFALLCILPMLLIVMVSISSEDTIREFGYRFLPVEYSLKAYTTILGSSDTLGRSYLISTFVTTVGTFLAILVTGMAGYTLANRHVRYRNALAFFFFVTMVFNPGIVPWYLVTYNLGLYNNILALIIPRLLFNPFNLFLTRNFMRGIPDSLMESAKIDGARDSYIAFRIYFPLSVPVLATIALFYGLAYWNDWFNAIMLVTNNDLHPLQYFLFRLQSEIQMIRDMSEYMVGTDVELPTETIKMATVIMTIGPIIFLYPFLQRYFVKGLVIGSVKG